MFACDVYTEVVQYQNCILLWVQNLSNRTKSHRLKKIKNRALTKILGPVGWGWVCGEVTGGQSKLRGDADKSVARPGMKQATATKLGIYSTHSPRSSIHFLARCSNFCKPLKKCSEVCPSNQVSAAAMNSASEEKWRAFNSFF